MSGYLISTANVFNVSPLDNAKLNKVFTNKCTTAQTKIKKMTMARKKTRKVNVRVRLGISEDISVGNGNDNISVENSCF